MAAESEPKVPEELAYTEEHEWIALDRDIGTVGITDYAQAQLGDIVFVELPEAGANVRKGEVFGTIEAVKTVEDLYAPISGEVVEVNLDLEDDAERVNKDPYGVGWMIKIRLDEEAELDETLSADEYRDHTAGGA
jgi:glycine cleavage system H protein